MSKIPKVQTTGVTVSWKLPKNSLTTTSLLQTRTNSSTNSTNSVSTTLRVTSQLYLHVMSKTRNSSLRMISAWRASNSSWTIFKLVPWNLTKNLNQSLRITLEASKLPWPKTSRKLLRIMERIPLLNSMHPGVDTARNLPLFSMNWVISFTFL